jgi:hypothetical protein
MRLSAMAAQDGWPSARFGGCTEPGLQAGSPAAFTDKFLPASNLKAGIHLKTPDGQTAVVVGGTIPKVHDRWMWDLSVPGNNDHDFYVLATGPFRMTDPAVLVHNIRCEALTVSYRRAFTRRIWTEIRSRSRTMSGVTCSMTPARRWDLT